jgi:putative restriction endonuclease
MKHWWVNQNQTYKHEVEGGYLWSPKTKTNGSRNFFYDTMTETQPGDVVFSFCDTYIKAIGIVTGSHESAPKPTEFGTAGDYWSHEGWYVPVQYIELASPIRPKDHMNVLGATLPPKYSPLQSNGDGNQGVYLAPVPPDMAVLLRKLLNGQVESVEQGVVVEAEAEADKEQQRIASDKTLPETERTQLVKARVGQGLFRSRVELIEPRCRVTGIADKRFLRASHIKPWSQSKDFEKLDGNNGLMLAPHVDHLFDKGFISFADDGSMLSSDSLPPAVLTAWSINGPAVLRPFGREQISYLAYHREHVFLGRQSKLHVAIVSRNAEKDAAPKMKITLTRKGPATS